MTSEEESLAKAATEWAAASAAFAASNAQRVGRLEDDLKSAKAVVVRLDEKSKRSNRFETLMKAAEGLTALVSLGVAIYFGVLTHEAEKTANQIQQNISDLTKHMTELSGATQKLSETVNQKTNAEKLVQWIFELDQPGDRHKLFVEIQNYKDNLDSIPPEAFEHLMDQATKTGEGNPKEYWDHVPVCDKCPPNDIAWLFEAGTEYLGTISTDAAAKSEYELAYLKVKHYMDQNPKLKDSVKLSNYTAKVKSFNGLPAVTATEVKPGNKGSTGGGSTDKTSPPN